MNIDRPGLHLPVRRQQALHKVLQPVSLLDDHLRVFAQPRVVEFVFEQLRGPAYATQGILDFVRQVSDQFAIGQLLLEQAFLAGRPDLLIDRPEFDKQPGAVRIDRIDRAVQVQHHVVMAFDLDILPAVAPAVSHGIFERFEKRPRAAGDTVHSASACCPATNGQQVFSRRIHIADDQRFVEKDHRRGKKVQAAERSTRGIRHARVKRSTCAQRL